MSDYRRGGIDGLLRFLSSDLSLTFSFSASFLFLAEFEGISRGAEFAGRGGASSGGSGVVGRERLVLSTSLPTSEPSPSLLGLGEGRSTDRDFVKCRTGGFLIGAEVLPVLDGDVLSGDFAGGLASDRRRTRCGFVVDEISKVFESLFADLASSF